jgi:hypothetical protein
MTAPARTTPASRPSTRSTSHSTTDPPSFTDRYCRRRPCVPAHPDRHAGGDSRPDPSGGCRHPGAPGSACSAVLGSALPKVRRQSRSLPGHQASPNVQSKIKNPGVHCASLRAAVSERVASPVSLGPRSRCVRVHGHLMAPTFQHIREQILFVY